MMDDLFVHYLFNDEFITELKAYSYVNVNCFLWVALHRVLAS
jgi:hypothetical protein